MNVPKCKQPPCKKIKPMRIIEKEDTWVFECPHCFSVQVQVKDLARAKALEKKPVKTMIWTNKEIR